MRLSLLLLLCQQVEGLPDGQHSCMHDTGGTCSFLPCDLSRDAHCKAGKCVCSYPTCVADGKCVAELRQSQRGPEWPAGRSTGYPNSCSHDTRGSCMLLSCDSSRHAHCVAGSCVCSEGQCAVNGVCQTQGTSQICPRIVTGLPRQNLS